MTITRRSVMLAGTACIGLPGALHAQRTGDRDARASIVDLLRDLVADPDHPLCGISVAWLYGHDQVARAWVGWRQLGADHPVDSRPIEADTHFRIASVSKLALALAMLRLHDDRLLDLDADLGPLLRHRARHPRHPAVPVTPRLILTHRSGLLDGVTLPLADGDALRRTLHDPASWGAESPGQMFRYCNFAYVVLATAMEAAARLPFDALMKRWLFDPLALSARYSPAALTPRQRDQLATLYRRSATGKRWVEQFDRHGDPGMPVSPAALQAVGENASVHSPHGGLRIGVPDLARLARLLIQQGRWEGRRLLSDDACEQLLRPHWTLSPQSPGETDGGLFRSWALGLQRFTDVRDAHGGDRLYPRGGWRAYGHLGDAYGLLSGLLFAPAEGSRPPWGLVYVINGTAAGAAEPPGRYSSLRRCEERVIEGLVDTMLGSTQTG
jgi:CubicO group peptidase (beta-lactamase class C family)